MVILGVAGLNFFLGVALFLFSVVSFFLTLELVSGSGGLNGVADTWDYHSHFIFYLQESFHLLDNSRDVRQSLMLQGGAP